ncbi:MAG: RNA methyltransferase [Saprospiraceae bacterium]|nr:RNA methyltransferase [Saprospiraceae bacterium]
MISQEFSKSKLKFLQSLKLKKYRQKYQTFLVEGRKVILEILKDNNLKIKSLYAENRWIDTHQDILRNLDIHVCAVSAPELKKISSLNNADQVCAEVQMIDADQTPLSVDGWLLYLDGISDPGNLGTIIRAADWFGVKAVCFGAGCADLYNPKSLQATMGSFAHVPAVSISAFELHAKADGKVWYLAELEGKPVNSIVPPASGGIIAIGSESHGITNEVRAIPHIGITIPKRPGAAAESLNAALATAIILNQLTS